MKMDGFIFYFSIALYVLTFPDDPKLFPVVQKNLAAQLQQPNKSRRFFTSN